MHGYSDHTNNNHLDLVGAFSIDPETVNSAVCVMSLLRYRHVDLPLRGSGRGTGYAHNLCVLS
jgi:hypothetical protein